ncbi:MAG: hypothetical protein OWQ59_00620 [Alicyclobacillaceae bacterium]|uniref:hypothetical protein n=1 Tax=Alicyclobacillus sp. SP_1 TaxID=2942475 RepID=UPI0021571CF6|nr:hypothetical protein [Alicyclobacillus sp. SP_1]MCY0886954.1 hypothetical protein [Alicyclobacillaceae bacterium]
MQRHGVRVLALVLIWVSAIDLLGKWIVDGWFHMQMPLSPWFLFLLICGCVLYIYSRRRR